MCCFSQSVERVHDTRIFARSLAGGRQALVYEMKLAARGPLAMVLPLPVPPASAEDAVRFVDLQACPTFFALLDNGFPSFAPQAMSFGGGPPPARAKALVVHDVGAFEASFVPRLADFDRLDERFRLPPQTWDALPAYRDWGFAVFKLRAVSTSPTPVHPMAFELPRRDPGSLFFPTVHVHDGKVHAEADFDHTLYCQPAAPPAEGWETSMALASAFAPPLAFELGLVHRGERIYRRALRGKLPNADTYV